MSNHAEQQQPQELRQSLLNELESSRQAIIELSDEDLEQVDGGRFSFGKFGKIAMVGLTIASFLPFGGGNQ